MTAALHYHRPLRNQSLSSSQTEDEESTIAILLNDGTVETMSRKNSLFAVCQIPTHEVAHRDRSWFIGAVEW
jgi:hypothetical protein